MKNVLFIFCFILTNFSFAQQTDNVDFKRVDALIVFNQLSVDSTIYNSYAVDFKILKDVDSVYLDAVNMRFKHVALNNSKAKFSNDGKKIIVYNNFKKGDNYKLSFVFFNAPKKAMYFVGWDNEGRNQIWTQGQGKYTSNWLPSLDDTNDKIEFDLKFLAPRDYTVVSNGNLKSKSDNAGYFLWEFDMQKPMSSYLVAVVVGKYSKAMETSNSGIPLEHYYYPKDSLKVESTYRYSKRMFDYLEEEIGFAYPWQNYKQVPVHDFLYAGMENTSATIFSDAFVVDAIGFNDKNYVNVNAHELAHQWFGDLVTAKSGEHHWLQEGFATYYALLAEREVFEDNYFYFKLFESAQDLQKQDLAGNGTSLLNAKSSSLTFYQRGAWVLHALRDMVGDAIFKQAVKNYLEKHQFGNVETSDFISEVELLAEQDMSEFTSKWIESKEFPFDEAMDLLKRQSKFIQEYIMVDCEAKTSKCAEYLKYYVSDEAKVKIISQVPELVTKDVFKNSLKVRQAISQYVTKIPEALKEDYESLLDDKSYITIESALYNLWVNFPLERSKFLAKTQNVIGFNDKNVRLLWLVLNLNTPDFQKDKKQQVYNELVSYTNERYNADLRISAFQYLDLIKACNTECQSNLENAKTHHNWRLVKFAKQLSEQLKQKQD
ncbi:M1 family metallopeptidase [Winogradskyella echinorum]|uniref:Aminopeptidase N n=1 Tax=Winogradskyella echinorum TaxID=538189 RepID=A0ABR6Y5G5_9FLAO|nr:M1 family metallopeptidase [Winogradskyella echinorum]MBC3847934.1 M1 family metallopeptidase [Winogradskyella echinorum]MBC5752282.1 M1 family metallopeptidase [Winogradskyella echinorum]